MSSTHVREAAEGWARVERAVMGMVERVAQVLEVKEMLGLVREGEDWGLGVMVKLRDRRCIMLSAWRGQKRG